MKPFNYKISLQELKRLKPGSIRAKWAFRKSVRVAFYRHLIAQTSNDVQVVEALKNYRPRLERKKLRDTTRVIDAIITSMQNGFTLDAALRPWVPNTEYGVLVSGVAANALAESLTQLLITDARARAIVTQIRTSFSVPAGNLAVAFAFMYFIGKSILPMFENLVPYARADSLVRGLYNLGYYAIGWGLPATILGIVVFIGLIIWSLTHWTGVSRLWAEKIFPWSYYRDMQGFLWLTSYASLLASGTKELSALGTQLTAASPWLSERLRAIRSRMQGGLLLPAALKNATPSDESGFLKIKTYKTFDFPNLDMIDDIESLHGFANFPERIQKNADQWAVELASRTAAMTKFMGFLANLLTYGLIIYIIYASNDLQLALSSMTNGMPH